MVSLTFYGGVDEIGGNKVLLEDDDARVFLDFGQSFTMGSDFFTGWLSPRAINGLGDYFEFGLLPKLRGLYAEEQLRFTDVPSREPRFDAVFLSHAHVDHVNNIQFLDPKIPVYLGVGTKLFLEAMEETSSFCNYGEHQYQMFRTGDKIKVGNIVVEPVHVDHSIPAAYGFIVYTSGGAVVYTGDFRLHGPRKDLTEDFLEKARGCEPTALISEGTRMVVEEKRRNYSELEVEERSDQSVSETDKMVLVTHYSRDMDRFRTFYQVAKNNDRKLVISPKTAFLLTQLMQDKRLNLPDPMRDENILVYYRRKKSGKFEEEDYYVWEREFMDKMVNYEFVHENQRDLVMNLDFYHFTELIDIKPDPASHFVHSMSEPFSEEDLEDQVMHNWLDHFNMKFHQLHSSGHLSREQLTKLIDYINPEKVFPVHTENQELFKTLDQPVQTVEYGRKYRL